MRTIFFSCLVLLTFSCKKSNNADCEPEQYHYTFKNNSQVDTVRYSPLVLIAFVNPGNKLVFNYEYNSPICSSMSDAEFEYKLVFEVPANATSFKYDQPTELETAKAYLIRSCYCNNVSYRLVTGSIEGTSITNNNWSVQVNVTEPVTNVSLSFNKLFKLD